MVHAGLLPSWTVAQSVALSKEVEAMMASDRAHEFLGVLYGDEPRKWSEDLMGYDRDRVRMVLNRADAQLGITRDDVEAIVGRAPDVLVPSHRDVTRSVNEGEPVVTSRSRSDAARAFDRLATIYEGKPAKRSGRRWRLGRRG